VAIKKNNDTFLLTLVDFLMQILFFSLFVFVAYQAMKQSKDRDNDPSKIQEVVQAAGVSNLTELNDELSKLAPIGLKGLNARLNKDGNATDINKVLAKLDQGTDKPPCLFDMVGDKKQARALGTLVGTNSSLQFISSTADMAAVVTKFGLNAPGTKVMSLGEFTRKFQPLLIKDPGCRYLVNLKEKTKSVDTRDAVQGIFYTRFIK
jgi:hypothetical protein